MLNGAYCKGETLNEIGLSNSKESDNSLKVSINKFVLFMGKLLYSELSEES